MQSINPAGKEDTFRHSGGYPGGNRHRNPLKTPDAPAYNHHMVETTLNNTL
jgi:hypothetical protein